VALLVLGFLIGSYFASGYAIALPEGLHKKLFGALLIVMGTVYIVTSK
jgi:uncharacterized membrane protein YfcA